MVHVGQSSMVGAADNMVPVEKSSIVGTTDNTVHVEQDPSLEQQMTWFLQNRDHWWEYELK